MTNTEKTQALDDLEKNLLDQTALDNRRWQLHLVNLTMGVMACFYGVVWYWLNNKGPAYLCFFSTFMAFGLHFFIKSKQFYGIPYVLL